MKKLKKWDTSIFLRLNKACAYFPCHEGLEDCTFCYCPFYPCGNSRLGKYVVANSGRKVWSCEDCGWIHKKSVVDKILNSVRKKSGKLKAKKTGVIILGHGSKLKKANDTILTVVANVKKNGLRIVEPAYLQLARPALSESVKKVVRKGCRRIVVVPFFLFMGNHVSRDIPKAIEAEARVHKSVEFVYAKNIGQDSRISDIVMDRIKEAL